jgi:hypothetical protein
METPTPQIIKFSITFSSGSGGSVSIPGGSYETGTNVSVTATPDSEYVFVNWSNGSTQNPLSVSVNSNQTISANFEKRKYPLTMTVIGEGIVSEEIISAGRTTTEYTSGSIIQLTAVPSDGWGFSGWSGTVSSIENPIQLTVDEAKSITSTFLEFPVPIMTLVSSQTKMFTKGVADTLLISINSGGGFKSIELSSDWGDISSVSSPEEGSLEGNLVVQYQPSQIKNVDYTRTIAGTDNLLITLTDQNDLTLTVSYTFRTQPEPILNRNYIVTSHDTESSRVKIDPNLIRFLNQRDNFKGGCGSLYSENNFGDTTNYNQNGNEVENIRDIAFIDINLDGYDDVVIHPVYYDGNSANFTSVKFPIETYLYEDGNYVFKEIFNQNGQQIKANLVTQFLVGDFDNDGNPDLYCANFGRDSPPYNMEDSFFIYNDYNSSGYYTQKVNPHVNFGHNASSGDIDKDGDLDVFQNGRTPESDGLFDFIINDGNRTFSKGSLLDDFKFVVYNDNVGYKFPFFMGIYTSELYDVDGDGNLDLFLIGHEYEDNYELMPWVDSQYLEALPWNASSGKIIYGNSDGTFTQNNLKYIPTIEHRGIGLDIDIYDLDGDGQKEIIILRTGDSTLGISSDSPDYNENQNSTNFYQGYYIQVCQIDENRNIIDVTNQFMDGNGQSGVALGCENTNFMFLQIGDYDNNGKLDMYCEDSRIGPNFVRWELNGSKFSRITDR